MRCSYIYLLVFVFLAVSSLSGQSLNPRIDSTLNGPRDTFQLKELNSAIVTLINTGQLIPDSLFDRTVALAEELEAHYYLSLTYKNRSMYDSNMGEIEKGLKNADKAIKIAQAFKHEKILADAYNMKLRMMNLVGRIKEAADLATDLVKKYHDEGNKFYEATTYLLLSRLSTSLGEYPMTLVYDATAIELARESNDPLILVQSLYSSAENSVLLGYSEKGLVLAEEAMQLAKKHDIKYVQGNIINARMGANIALGNYGAALEDYKPLAELEGEQKFPWWMTTRGLLLQRIGRNEEARELLLDAAGLIRERSNSPVSLTRTYRALKTVDLDHAAYDSLVRYETLIRAQEDSLQANKNIKHLQELDEKYKAGEKDAAIRLQKEKLATQRTLLYVSVGGLLFTLAALLGFLLLSQRLKKRNRENEMLLIEKETLIGEIHHRVKNNLQVVSSLLQIQRRGLSSDDKKGREALRESQNRVSAMGLIHNKLYQGKNITAVRMPDYLKDLGETLLDAYRIEEQVDVFYDVADLSLDIDVAISLGLIINELVTNSIKYAFPSGKEGLIEISLHRNNDQLTLLVSDNGVGASAAEKRADSTSFGTNLIELLTKKLKGSLKVLKGDGYGVEIVFAATTF